jgi:hypothetical protein
MYMDSFRLNVRGVLIATHEKFLFLFIDSQPTS